MATTSSSSSASQTGILSQVADLAMLDRDFVINFSSDIIKQLDLINDPVTPFHKIHPRDMRQQPWISIDNEDTLDIDQLTFAEQTEDGSWRIYTAIAGVAAAVAKGTPIDQQAAHNTTSVYTGVKVFPMLHPRLSTDLTSLNEGVDRFVVVVEIDVDQSGRFDSRYDVYPAWVNNKAKLNYNDSAAWLDGKNVLQAPPEKAQQQLRLQDQIAKSIASYRETQGALIFESDEYTTVLRNGVPLELKRAIPNRANALIENVMIATNVAVSNFLIHRNLPIIKRIVKTPKRWEQIVELAKKEGYELPSQPDVKALQGFLIEQKQKSPDKFQQLSLSVIKLIGRGEYVIAHPQKPSPGHFDLALQDYSHTTAPNRRFPDLVMQRLLLANFQQSQSSYTEDELEILAQHCTEKEDDAVKVERRVRKSAAALLLQPQLGKQFGAIVTGASEKGTWVKLLKPMPPIEGKLVQGFEGLMVGDVIQAKLVNLNVKAGFIDFERVSN